MERRNFITFINIFKMKIMAVLSQTTVESRIESGYEFKFGDYLSQGFKIFSKEWLLFSLYGLVSMLLLILSFLTIVGWFFTMFPLMMGFCVAAEKVDRGEELHFSDFFGAFKNLGDYAIYGLIIMLCFLLVLSPFILFAALIFFDSLDNSPFLSFGVMGLSFYMFALIFVLYPVQIFLFFTPYLIHYGDFSAVQAMKLSFRLAKKNFWWLLLFVFVVGFISGIGQYLCLVGIFVSIAAAGCMNYAMVKDVLLNEDATEIDEIGKLIQ